MKKIIRKSLLYKSGVEYADFCLNHVEGCSHGCRYPCYAYMMKKRCGRVSGYEEWCRPKIVGNALELLDREIPRYQARIKNVQLCFSTDPFMYQQDAVTELSLEIIAKLNSHQIPCSILTKGVYPRAILNANGAGKINKYGITLVSLDEEFREHYEPHAAPFSDRIAALRRLHKSGYRTWVSVEPYPTPNIIQQDLVAILEKVSFVDEVVFGRLNYNAEVSEFKLFRQFYNSQAKIVKEFCKKSRQSLHIKRGTIG
ncbi:MAG: radical SAM protein [Lentisphaerae bacterium GWF2_52_8]|nr:MAG: radical SAM protein [Lentisphaerae bacterium GWF2_52_8]